MLGAAIATTISDIPFDGPISTTQVGLVDGEFVFNPTAAQRAVSDMALTVASTKRESHYDRSRSKRSSRAADDRCNLCST